MTPEQVVPPVPAPRPADVTEELLYRALLACFSDISVLVFDKSLRYTSVAGAVARLGWRPEDIIGRRPSEVMPSGEGRLLEVEFAAALEGQTRDYEHSGLRDPSAHWSSTIVPVRAADGTVVAGAVISRNVAPLRDAEAARRMSEERFAVALEAAPVLVFTQDAQLRFTWANKSMLHPNVAMILGKTDDEVLPPDAAAATVEVKRRVMTTGIGERLLLQATMPHGVRYFDMTVEPSRDDEGAVSGIIGAALDVTELRASEQRLLAALESVMDSVSIQQPVRDSDGSVHDFVITYVTASARDFAGRGRHELVGHTIRELYPSLDSDFVDGYVRVLTTGEPMRVLAFPFADGVGSTRLFDLTVSRLGDGLLVVWRDVTEREVQRATVARSEAVRSLSEQLQRALLPPDPPPIVGLEFAATYHPAAQTAEVGGDWYSVVEVPTAGGRLVDVIVGDVEGHDGQAAALMARVSTLLTSVSLRSPSVADVLAEARAFHDALDIERTVCVLVARVDLVEDHVRLASAGHVGPLLARANGEVQYVNVDAVPPIGTPGAAPPEASDVTLARGERLIMFSDGLLDPRLDVDEALQRLMDIVASHRDSELQGLVDALASTTAKHQPPDDAVVIAVQRPL